MKKFLFIFSLFILSITVSFAQEDDNQGGKMREHMTEYIQKRLGLSSSEAERFSPVFLNYFNDLRKTNQENREDRLVLQQKIVELKLNYRNQFKNIVGEKKSNDVFIYERDFIQEVKNRLQRDRQQGGGGGRPGNKKRGLLQ
jgi:nitrate reductase assembly molybdenum cofactor insertion protein NarJ